MTDRFIYQRPEDDEYVRVSLSESGRTAEYNRVLDFDGNVITDFDDLPESELDFVDQDAGDEYHTEVVAPIQTMVTTTTSNRVSLPQFSNPRAKRRSLIGQAPETIAMPVINQVVVNTSGNIVPSTMIANAAAAVANAPGLPSMSTTSQTQTTATGSSENFRIRLSHLPGARNPYPGILSILQDTSGLMFPYTPTIAVTQDVDYQTMAMTHSNTDYLSYSRTPNVNITISGKFTVQNRREGLYAMAAIHFLRSVSKMHFGESDAANTAGIPPPILHLNGYGAYMFNKLRVLVKSHNWTFDENMQLVDVLVGGKIVKIPPMFTLSITLAVQQTARAHRKDFSLDRFRSGELMAGAPNNTGWI